MKRILLLTLLLAGCSSTTTPESPHKEISAFAHCTEIPEGLAKLPKMSLPCVNGGSAVEIGQIGGPAIINLWASWCGPCREELPALQRLADTKTMTVIGVATEDQFEAAASIGTDFNIRMPVLWDPAGKLRRELGEANLPVTLFIDSAGKVTRYVGPALTDETLAGLVSERLGLT